MLGGKSMWKFYAKKEMSLWTTFHSIITIQRKTYKTVDTFLLTVLKI